MFYQIAIEMSWNIIPVRILGFNSLRVRDVYKMYTINSRWVDDKRVTTLANGPATIGGVSSLYPSYVGRDLYFAVKKKKLSASLYTSVHVRVYACEACFLSRFISLFPRSSCRGEKFACPCLPVDIVCTGNPYLPAAFITGGQIIRWTRPRDLYR